MRNFKIASIVIIITILLTGCGLSASKARMAIITNNFNALKQEINNGSNVYEKDDTLDVSLLVTAASKGNMHIIKYLVNHGIDVNQVGKYGITALLEASTSNRARVVEYLLSKGANKYARYEDSIIILEDYRGKNALEIAQMNNNQEIIDLLTNRNKKITINSTKFIKKPKINKNNQVIKKIENKKVLTEDEKLEQWINQELELK